MAYFSTWPHENRVSKTRFINLIKVKEEPREKKKKKTRNRERRTRAARHARPRPGRTATQADRSRFFSLSVSGFFSFLCVLLWYVMGRSPLLSDLILSHFHLIVVFLDYCYYYYYYYFFVYFDLYKRLESYNFFKFFLVYKSSLRHSISK